MPRRSSTPAVCNHLLLLFGVLIVVSSSRFALAIPATLPLQLEAVVAGASQHILRLLYGKNIRVDPGREYPLEAIVKAGQPVVSFNGPEPTELYTLIMLDFDVPAASKPAFLHWLVVNIPATKIGSGGFADPKHPGGLDLAKYFPPSPPEIGKLHRYAFLLLEQTAGPIGQYEDGAFEETRANFRLNEFRTINELSSQASAFNYFGTRRPKSHRRCAKVARSSSSAEDP